MSEEQRLQVILIDDGGWVSKTFIKEVQVNRPDVDIKEILTVPPKCPLTEILDKIPRPETLDIIEDPETGVQEVANKTTIWLPFTNEGCRERQYLEQKTKIEQDYPYLSIALYYGQMSRSWLHELARKHGIVPIENMVDENGVTQKPPAKLTKENILEQRFTDRKGRKFKINILKAKPLQEPKEVSALDKIKENQDEGKLYPAETGIDEEGSGVDSKKTKKVNK